MRSALPSFAMGILLLLLAELGCRLLQGAEAGKGFVRAWTVHNVLDRGKAEGLVPLAGLSRRPTYLCREAAGDVTYLSDSFGFHNGPGAWKESPDLLLIGDSFVQGHCVPEGAQLASLLALRGRRVLNLGLRGSGPLSQLGVLQEYALPRKPKRILWFVLANDFLFDLERELRIPALAAYYEGKTQGLAHRQAEVDSLLGRWGASRPPPSLRAGLAFPAWLTTTLFSALRPEPTRPIEEGRPEDFRRERMALFAGILASGKQFAQAQGVAVDFVFIPDSWVFTKAEGARVRALVADLTQELRANGIDLHDPTEEFAKDGHPFRRFAALEGYYGHYNEKGYRLLAGFLQSTLPLPPGPSGAEKVAEISR